VRLRWAPVLLIAAAFALGGCGRPAGIDGDLTNAWPAFPKAVTPVPAVGACYPTAYDETWYGDFANAVPCSGEHQTETVYVGTFTGADADRSAPPLGGTPARRTAYDQCQTAANAYLGGQWQDGRVDLGLTLPDDKAWAGGARWYRCDVVKYTDSNYSEVDTVGSVKDGLKDARPLAVTCLTLTDDGKGIITDVKDTPCAQGHNAEYMGLYTAPDSAYPSDQTARHKLAENGCEKMLSNFLGYGGGTPYSNYVGWWPGGFSEDQWNLGDRTEHCYAVALHNGTVNNVRVVGSMKGLRSAAPRKA
jgi:putative regulator of septum formation